MNLFVESNRARERQRQCVLIGTSDAHREQLFMSSKPPRKKTSVTSLVQSTFTLTLVPTREGEAPPQATPPGLPPQQGPEKKEERTAELETTAETVMSSGRLNFNSKTGAGSVSSDKEAYHSVSQRKDSKDRRAYESQSSNLSHDG